MSAPRLVEDQIEAGAQVILAFLQRPDPALRLLISRAIVPTEKASWRSRIREQTLPGPVARSHCHPPCARRQIKDSTQYRVWKWVV